MPVSEHRRQTAGSRSTTTRPPARPHSRTSSHNSAHRVNTLGGFTTLHGTTTTKEKETKGAPPNLRRKSTGSNKVREYTDRCHQSESKRLCYIECSRRRLQSRRDLVRHLVLLPVRRIIDHRMQSHPVGRRMCPHRWQMMMRTSGSPAKAER